MARAYVQWMNAYLPPNSPVLRNDHTRRKLHILVGLSFTLFAVQLVRAPAQLTSAPAQGALTFFESLFAFGVWLGLILFKGRRLTLFSSVLILFYYISTTVDSFLENQFPPSQYFYTAALIVAMHYLLGRYFSLAGFLLHMVIVIALRALRLGILTFTARWPFENDYFFHLFFSGMIIWLVLEAYERARDSTELNLKKIQRELERDFEVTRRIQLDLLPMDGESGGYEHCGFMRTAIRVGGDYYGRWSFPGVEWLAIGDVSGHGMQAGMFVMQVRTMMERILLEDSALPPSEVIRKINNSFFDLVTSLRNLPIRTFMSFLSLKFMKDGNVVYAGSHQDILHYRVLYNDVVPISTDGLWMGLRSLPITDNPNQDRSLQMEIGDTLLLFSDGITECRNKMDEEFGIQGLINAFRNALERTGGVRLDEVRDTIYSDLLEYAGSEYFDDDVTLLLIRRMR